MCRRSSCLTYHVTRALILPQSRAARVVAMLTRSIAIIATAISLGRTVHRISAPGEESPSNSLLSSRRRFGTTRLAADLRASIRRSADQSLHLAEDALGYS